MRIEFYTTVSRRKVGDAYIEYIAIPKRVKPHDLSLHKKKVHVIIEVLNNVNS